MNHPKPIDWVARIFLLLWFLVLFLLAATDVMEPFKGEGAVNFAWLTPQATVEASLRSRPRPARGPGLTTLHGNPQACPSISAGDRRRSWWTI